MLSVGDTAMAELTLPDGTAVGTGCQVLRLDEGSHEAVLTLDDLSDADAAVLSHSVLAQLTASGGSPVSAGA
jgi:hypothetical protein